MHVNATVSGTDSCAQLQKFYCIFFHIIIILVLVIVLLRLSFIASVLEHHQARNNMIGRGTGQGWRLSLHFFLNEPVTVYLYLLQKNKCTSQWPYSSFLHGHCTPRGASWLIIPLFFIFNTFYMICLITWIEHDMPTHLYYMDKHRE